MQQRGGVNEFNDRGKWDVLIAIVTAGVCTQQYQQWAEALTATFYDVVADFLNQRDVGAQVVDDVIVDGFELWFDLWI